MHNQAVRAILARTKDPNRDAEIRFVSPIVSTAVAAAAVTDQSFRELRCREECQGYADMIGLTEAINGDIPVGKPSELHGQKFSRLTRLYHPTEVEGCNQIISDLLHANLDGEQNAGFINAVVKVVGELHDNVPSHSNGVGFSAAQVYCNTVGCRLEFAITDCGCGMLHNVRKVDKAVQTDIDAIEWCLERRHTTAKPLSGLEQKVPDDSIISPFPAAVTTVTSYDQHHVGEGLWCLTTLIREIEGSVWIWSGNGALLIGPDGTRTAKTTDTKWCGLAIEMELDLGKAQAFDDGELSPSLQEIAERLGL
ncbi:MAG TPA: hypothetical protein VGG64_21065 [Pirellulales bacterium]|jgi:hypothetical protein